jgi:hypothetical protein
MKPGREVHTRDETGRIILCPPCWKRLNPGLEPAMLPMLVQLGPMQLRRLLFASTDKRPDVMIHCLRMDGIGAAAIEDALKAGPLNGEGPRIVPPEKLSISG